MNFFRSVKFSMFLQFNQTDTIRAGISINSAIFANVSLVQSSMPEANISLNVFVISLSTNLFILVWTLIFDIKTY